jgi:hypothetical protein
MPEDTNFDKLMDELIAIKTDVRLMRGESWDLYRKIELQQDRINTLEDLASRQMSLGAQSVALAEIEGIKKDRRVVLGLLSFIAVSLAALKFSISVEDGSFKGAISSNDGAIERIIQALGAAGVFGVGGYNVWAAKQSLDSRKRVQMTRKSVLQQEEESNGRS